MTRMRQIVALLACLAMLSGLTAMVPRQVVRAEDVSSTAATGVEKIVFTGEFTGNREIWMMNPDGTELEQLTFHPGYNQLHPEVSPDGTKIAFTSNLDETDPNKEDVFVLDLVSGVETNLTAWQGRDRYPSWSPGGNEIVFDSDRQGPQSLWRVPAKGGEATRVTDPSTDSPQRGYDNCPHWGRTPEGDKVVFHAWNADGAQASIYEMALTEGAPVTDTPRKIIDCFAGYAEFLPRYSPDGQKFIWVHGEDAERGQIWVADRSDPEGSKQRITYDPDQEFSNDADWSPDGRKIVFTTGEGYSIRIMDVETKVMTAVIVGGMNPDWCVMPQLSETMPPVARAEVDPYVNPVGTPFTFDGSASYDPDGTIVSYEWRFGDGQTATGAVASHSYAAAGLYEAALIVTDDDGLTDNATALAVVYDPSAGFVTGGGWINSPEGAYGPDPLLTGKATFGFVAKYQKGQSVPTGQTQFQFHAAGLDFKSTSYEWLVVAGAKAKYKGSGTINGGGDYGFMLSAVDGQIKDGGGVDKFRIKIWDKATSEVIYDNQIGDGDDEAATTAIGGGSIVIHAK